ncbi:MAG: flagellar biosynthesis regulator FlaF [Alphaproteobacteria bacterium]
MADSNANQLYGDSQKLAAGPRQTEARALLEAARRMADARGNMQDLTAYRAALRLNWRLWTIIQADVSSAENPLPQDMKNNVLSLSIFIDKQTVAALAEPSAKILSTLIDLNRNIAGGLMQRSGAPAPSAPTPPPSSGSGSGIVA